MSFTTDIWVAIIDKGGIVGILLLLSFFERVSIRRGIMKKMDRLEDKVSIIEGEVRAMSARIKRG